MSLKRVHFKWPLEELDAYNPTTTHDYDSVPSTRLRSYKTPLNSSKGVLGSRIRRFDPHKREDRSPEEDYLVTKSLCLPTPYDRTSPDDEHLTHSWSAGVPPSSGRRSNVRKYKDLAPRRYPQTMSPKMERSEKFARTAGPQSPPVIKRPYVKDTSVIVRPRSVKHRHQSHQREADFLKDDRSLHRRDPTPPSTLKLRDVFDDDDEDDYYEKKRANEMPPTIPTVPRFTFSVRPTRPHHFLRFHLFERWSFIVVSNAVTPFLPVHVFLSM
uniref:Uncharacterized protein n=1 Tax=Panagrellus redivivus TaxID=6233 RepID=A0A7E4VVD2_PANRE